jgi:hypothetical protein
MELTPDLVPLYLELVSPEDTPERRRERVENLRENLATGQRHGQYTRVQVASAGEVIGSLALEPFGATGWILHGLRVKRQASSKERLKVCELIDEAASAAQEAGVTKLLTRVTDEVSFPEYEEALRASGFKAFERRIEFAMLLSSAPADEGGTFTWRAMSEVPRRVVIHLLEDVLHSQPHASPTENAEAALQDYLSSPDQTTGPECVQIGFVGRDAAALVIAQVLPTTGWGTLTEMGLARSYRGRRLGAAVQRHGFAMLREQGGTHYRGGTSTDNVPMLRVFRANGCKEHSRMTEWRAGDW